MSDQMNQTCQPTLDTQALVELSDKELQAATGGGLMPAALARIMEKPAAKWTMRALDVATIGGAAYSLEKSGTIGKMS
jgi:hypothetical protein